MQQLLRLSLCLSLSLGLCLFLPAQTVLEDFEGNEADLDWNAYEGTFAVVGNPVDTTSNTSEFVGSYTKSGAHAFSAFIAELGDDNLDLSVNNQFSIQVYTGAATQLLMKLEKSSGGQAIEQTVNIATPNVWRTYTFDFSGAADLDSLNRIILFFDPNVEESADTYLFDNIVASPAGPCAGVETDPTVIDDFECQRNATYGVPGFDDIMVIENPDRSGINTSDSVGQYTDREGGFHALVIDYNDPIDLTTNNNLCMKVWAPVTGNLLFKLEGGTSPAVEQGVQITETETWVEVCADFSAQADASYTRIVFFLNAGVAEADGDIYYLDDITLTPAPPAEAIEDFEGGASLTWGPLNGNATLNGTFDGAIPNPDTEGNTSATVGSYTRGTAQFSTLTAPLPAGIDLSNDPQLNLDVWAPDANTTVTVQLVSAIEGAKTAEATTGEAMSWTTLSFNFEDFAGITDFGQINIIFAPETDGTGTYYFDNLAQGASTVDACVDVEPDPSTLDDFECQRNAEYTVGAEFLSVVDNPDGGADSPNQSTRVGAFEDQPGSFNALAIQYDEPIDLSLRNQFTMTAWAPIDGQILVKLEGDDVTPVEVFVDIDTTQAWSTYTVDFSGSEGTDFTRVVLFFGAGADNAEAQTYFIDDLGFSRPAYVSSCVSTFENVDFSVTNWNYFGNGSVDGTPFTVIANPDVSGGNMSDSVGVFVEATDGETFAGMAADLEAPVALPNGSKILTAKIWMPIEADVVFKLEQGLDGAPGSGDVMARYDTPNEWAELTFDFSSLPDGARYGRLTFIPNIGVTPTEEQTYYFDDIAVGGGDCANLVSVFTLVTIKKLTVYPNPVTDRLIIDNGIGAERFELTSMLGQRVTVLDVDGARSQVPMNMDKLKTGTYVLTATDAAGRPVARTLVVKR